MRSEAPASPRAGSPPLPIGLGLAVDGHHVHAAMLAAGEVQLVQEAGHGGTAGQIDGGPAPGLVGQQGTEARK